MDARKFCNSGVEQVNDDRSFSSNAFATSSTTLSRSSFASYGTKCFAVPIKNSRDLKPTQMLLQEIVSVGGKAVEINNEKYIGKLFPSGRK